MKMSYKKDSRVSFYDVIEVTVTNIFITFGLICRKCCYLTLIKNRMEFLCNLVLV